MDNNENSPRKSVDKTRGPFIIPQLRGSATTPATLDQLSSTEPSIEVTATTGPRGIGPTTTFDRGPDRTEKILLKPTWRKYEQPQQFDAEAMQRVDSQQRSKYDNSSVHDKTAALKTGANESEEPPAEGIAKAKAAEKGLGDGEKNFGGDVAGQGKEDDSLSVAQRE